MAPHPDPAWLEAQYNNRARVPNHGEILARWARESARVRSTAACQLDVPYGNTEAEKLDVFRPEHGNIGQGAPLLVFIHGGWWRALDKSDHSFVAPAFTAAGAVVVMPNYGLCPSISIKEITRQMTRCLAWCWREARVLGADPHRIAVAGHSAGGHLAAMMLGTPWKELDPDLPNDLVKTALSISGVYDLEPIRHTHFLQADLRLTPESVRDLSPAGFPAPDGTLRTVVGALESEEFLRHNRLIRERWGPIGVPVCEQIPEADHFTVVDSMAQPGTRLHKLTLEMLGLPS